MVLVKGLFGAVWAAGSVRESGAGKVDAVIGLLNCENRVLAEAGKWKRELLEEGGADTE